MSLNWLGASTNSFRILLASSIAAIKSPTLKPKLIAKLARSLSYVKDSKGGKYRDRVCVCGVKRAVGLDNKHVVCVG